MRGVLAMQNGIAPRGWVEIQRNDQNDTYVSDLEAARSLVERAGVNFIDYVWERNDEDGHVRVFVPAHVAHEAGVITWREMLEAHARST